MKKGLLPFLLLFYSFFTYSQQGNNNEQSSLSVERFPVFSECENGQSKTLESCFYNQVQDFIFQNFQIPDHLKQNNFQGSVKVLFEVDDKGVFKVIYVDAIDEALVKESKRVFDNFPKIQPATYNGKPTYSKYTISISIPLKNKEQLTAEALAQAEILHNNTPELTELDSIVYKKFNNPEFESHLNVPFSHSYYAQFDSALNRVGINNHTSSKPYTYAEVSKYYDLKAVNEKLKKNTSGWWARKLWNENTVAIQGDGYWFTINPIFDLQVGKSSGLNANKTFINTRGINFRGGIGEQINFTTTVFESQGRFADYFNRYAESIKPAGGNPAIIPGMGIAKDFKIDAYDFPLAEANLTFTANQSVYWL